MTGPQGKAAASKEEDLALTLRIIMDHDARSTTVSKEQFIQQMEESSSAAPAEENEETADVSVPYDAAARLAYDASGDKSVSFDDFLPQYLADAVAHVKSKQAQPEVEEKKEEIVEAVAQAPPSEPATDDSSPSEDNDPVDAPPTICKGSVKWFDKKKGFGFLTSSDGTDVFVHQSQIQADGFRSLEDGAEVEFKIEVRNGRSNAIHVTAPNGERFQRGYAYKKRGDGDATAESNEEEKQSYYF